MLTILVQVLAGVAVLGFLAFAVLCAGVRADDAGPGLRGRAPGPAAWLARRCTGLKTESAPGPAPRPGRERSRAARRGQRPARALQDRMRMVRARRAAIRDRRPPRAGRAGRRPALMPAAGRSAGAAARQMRLDGGRGALGGG